MIDTLSGSFYDYPRYYELVYGSDWKAELAFLRGCFTKHGSGAYRRLFEPACGTGRLMFRLARTGYDVAGNDLNDKAVEYCNRRLSRHGFGEDRAVVGRMENFQLRHRVDAAYNTINSFRHLVDERTAEQHLECIARALRPGGLYILGMHLTPAVDPGSLEESWAARRGNLGIVTQMKRLDLDRRKRHERFFIRYDVYTPTRRLQLNDEIVFRTYTVRQIRRLIARCGLLTLTACYDFAYDLDTPHQLGPASEDVVLVLKRA